MACFLTFQSHYLKWCWQNTNYISGTNLMIFELIFMQEKWKWQSYNPGLFYFVMIIVNFLADSQHLFTYIFRGNTQLQWVWYQSSNTKAHGQYTHGLVQDCSISSVLAMNELQSCTKSLIQLGQNHQDTTKYETYMDALYVLTKSCSGGAWPLSWECVCLCVSFDPICIHSGLVSSG